LLINVDIAVLVDRDCMLVYFLVDVINNGAFMNHNFKAEPFSIVFFESKVFIQPENDPRHVV
jgi:hypothetical protein